MPSDKRLLWRWWDTQDLLTAKKVEKILRKQLIQLVSSALEILLELNRMDVSGRRGLLKGFLPIVKSLLDDLFRMTPTQYRTLFRCFVNFCCG